MKLCYAMMVLCMIPTVAAAQEQSMEDRDIPNVLKVVREVPPASLPVRENVFHQVSKCWNARSDTFKTVKTITIIARLDRNGRFTNLTIPKKDGPQYHTDIGYRAAANELMAAMVKCQPIRGLPADKYEGWKDMELTFDPRMAMPVTSQEMPPTGPNEKEIFIQQKDMPASTLYFPNGPGKGKQVVIPAEEIH